MSNGTTAGNGNGGSQLWWWRAAATTLLGLLATMMVKGCDEWQQTNDAIEQQGRAISTLASDVRYQVERVQQREQRLGEVEKNLQLVYERSLARFETMEKEMLARFEERRTMADQIVRDVYERLNQMRFDQRQQASEPPRRDR